MKEYLALFSLILFFVFTILLKDRQYDIFEFMIDFILTSLFTYFFLKSDLRKKN